MPVKSRLSLAVALAAISLTTGCSLFQEGFSQRASHGAGASSVVREWLEPVVSHEYLLENDSQSVVGDLQIIALRDDDTFSDIARSYGLGYDELVNANPGIDPWLPEAGAELILPTRFVLPDAPREGIVLNIAAKRLYYYPPRGDDQAQRVVTYPIGIGRVGWATPTGTAKVIAKATDPAWYVPLSVRQEHRELGDPLPAVVPPGPDNPLGRHVLKLDMPGYLLHGTNKPYGVGMRVSHGCVRLYPEDIEVLYQAASLGTGVTIVNQPVTAGWRDEAFFVTAYPQLEDDERDADALFEQTLAHLRDRHWMLRDEQGSAQLAQLIADSRGVAAPLFVKDETPAARYVKNVSEAPLDAPSREEVARLIDEMMLETPEAVADE